MINLRQRIRRLDLLDFAMIKLTLIIIGVIIATYISPLRGFIEQNILVVIFLVIVIGFRPCVRYWKNK
jgi:positive regulator of sigma E activity